MFKDWGERLQEQNRSVPVSAFATTKESIIVKSTCGHVYKYLRKNEHGNDVFYCEKCLEYKVVFNN